MTLPNGLDSRLVRDISLVVNRMYEGITPEDEDCEDMLSLPFAPS
jgi:hypothetical protein